MRGRRRARLACWRTPVGAACTLHHCTHMLFLTLTGRPGVASTAFDEHVMRRTVLICIIAGSAQEQPAHTARPFTPLSGQSVKWAEDVEEVDEFSGKKKSKSEWCHAGRDACTA